MIEDYLLIVVAVLFTLVSGTVLYYRLRPRYSIKVNCWFCNKNTVVPFGNRNCWDCPFCEQYNGFDKDGDYNKPIPAQRLENLNHQVNAVVKGEEPINEFTNNLCEKCTRNQRLKIKQLAKFKPHFDQSFDEEVTKFSRHLDQVYQLCLPCENILQNKLRKETASLQSKILDHQLNDSFDQETVLSRSIYHSKLQSNSSLVIRMTTILLAIVLFFCDLHNLQEDCGKVILSFEALLKPSFHKLIVKHGSSASSILPVIGLLGTVLAVFKSGKYRLQKSDGLTCFAWVFVLFVHNQPIYFLLPKQDILLLCPLMSLLVMVLSTISTACRRYTFMRSLRGKLINKQSRPSPAGKLRSLNSSYDSCTWDDAFSSISQQTCKKCFSQIAEEDFPAPVASDSKKSVVNGEVKKLPSNFCAMKISSSPLEDKECSKRKGIYHELKLSEKNQAKASDSSFNNRSRPLLQPPKFDLIGKLDHSKPYSRSSWVDGGFWDNNFVRGNINNSVSSNRSSFTAPVSYDRFSAVSEPVFSSQRQHLFQRNSSLTNTAVNHYYSTKLGRKIEDKTSEYGSDSQISLASHRQFHK